ncbi:TPA: ATP-binding cassette domain-containing protein, partial [Staphylococcus aureus]|nr:ATP-binding cassette domain-containing protein [Staphylococcus aureus]
RFGDFNAVRDISFTVARGTTHALVGESGSGKTTTGRAISLFSRPTEGTIRLSGEELTGVRGKRLRELRQKIQLVYQNPFSSLDPRLSIGETIA